ncbi:LysM peptidoglycan-binding domain-containing protein [Paenibacillus sp. P22]|uniref:LysM peptidoglycan-binding domain-containing protein n=1 Tax=Paenibacillus sp. P22 TaxID=483908 RepID=UPI00038FFFB2|nr:LysM peptidoglycan-binding domain-containing protein [Paenibacillus sp. P22]CDN45375.1 Peptidoglycan-binding LysM [Paenibacillus sp. P22]
MSSTTAKQGDDSGTSEKIIPVLLPFTIWLSWDNSTEGFPLPVMPEKISISRGGRSSDYQVLGTGSVSVPESPELAEISFESFFPQQETYPFIHPYYSIKEKEVVKEGVVIKQFFKLKPPSFYVQSINKWMASGYLIRVIYIGADAAKGNIINLPMTIESFERYEEAGSAGDVFYSLKLKEYAFFSPRKVKAVQKNGQTALRKEASTRPDERIPPQKYVLRSGDTLIGVSKSQLGDSGRWREIQKLNGIKDSELNRLQAGRTLQLPPKKR